MTGCRCLVGDVAVAGPFATRTQRGRYVLVPPPRRVRRRRPSM